MKKLRYFAAAALLAAAMTVTACGGSASSSSSSSGAASSSETASSSSETVSSVSSESAVSSESVTASSEPAASSSEDISSESAVSASSAVGPDANVTDVAPDLSVILTEIQTNIEIGTAGSSLKATIVAADVLDFTMSTDISEEYLEEQTAKYMEGLSEEDRINFPDQMVMAGEAIHTLKDGDGEALLEDAGVTESSYPWNDEAYNKADAILRGAGI